MLRDQFWSNLGGGGGGGGGHLYSVYSARLGLVLISLSLQDCIYCPCISLSFQDKDAGAKRRCPVCRQLRTASDTTPDGLIHRVLGRSNAVWCPYADSPSLLEEFDTAKKAKQQANWRKANQAKKLRKQQASTESSS